jgi:hypothetical protein
MRDRAGPADGEGEVNGDVVALSLRPGEGHAIVGGDDDKGVVQQSAALQLRQHAAEVGVEMLHLERVVEQIGPRLWSVGPMRRKRPDVVRDFAALGHAGAGFIGAMRLRAAVPEEPGGARRGRIEKIDKVGGVVVARDARGGGGALRF